MFTVMPVMFLTKLRKCKTCYSGFQISMEVLLHQKGFILNSTDLPVKRNEVTDQIPLVLYHKPPDLVEPVLYPGAKWMSASFTCLVRNVNNSLSLPCLPGIDITL